MSPSRSASHSLAKFTVKRCGRIHFFTCRFVSSRYDTGSLALRGNCFLHCFTQVSFGLIVSRLRLLLTPSTKPPTRRARKRRVQTRYILAQSRLFSLTLFVFARPDFASCPALSACWYY